MAQPPAYNREKNFTLNSGRETDHSALNAELDRASNSINDIRTNLAILQADDGKLRPSVVTSDSISMELRTTLVEGVVMDAQAMLDRSLVAADVSSSAAEQAKKSEEMALQSLAKAINSARAAQESAKVISLAVNSDWNARQGPAQILNKPALSVVAMSGHYDDLDGKPQNLATESDIAVLQEEIAKKGVPVGSIEFFAMVTPPASYLKADGAAVGRTTYPELYAAIGTTFGEGDGETTFNLPDLIGRFAQGSNTPGQKIEAGLPNIIGAPSGNLIYASESGGAGPFRNATGNQFGGGQSNSRSSPFDFDASRSNPIYGASDTVQPPALTLLPCIKAFDAATNPGLIDITELANEVANKADRDLANANPAQSFKDAAISWGVPDYNAGIDITAILKASPYSYTAPVSGIIKFISLDDTGWRIRSDNANTNDHSVNELLCLDGQSGVYLTGYLPVSEEQKIFAMSGTGSSVIFYPLQGVI